MADEIISVFKAETDEAVANVEKYRKSLEANEAAEQELTKAMTDEQKKRLKLLQDEIEDLEELTKARDALKKNTGVFNAKEISEYNKRINETKGRIDQLGKSLGLAAGDTKKLAKEAAVLEKETKKQATANEKVAKSHKDVTSHTKESTEAHKVLHKVGHDAFHELDHLTHGLAGKIKGLYTSIVTVVRGMKLFRVALISTGIGALVVALGSVIAYFTQTQRGANALSKVMKAVGAVVHVLVEAFASIGETIVNAFVNPKQALIDFGNAIKQFLINRVTDILNGFKGIGQAVQFLFEGQFKKAAQAAGQAALDLTTGFLLVGGAIKDAIPGIKELSHEIAHHAQLAYELEAAYQALTEREINLITVNAQLRAAIEAARLSAEDETLGFEKRLAALDEAQRLEIELFNNQIEHAAENARILTERVKMNKDASNDERKEAAEAQADVIELQGERDRLLRMHLRRRNQLQHESDNAALNGLKAISEAEKAARELAIRLVEEAATHEQVVLDELYLQKLISQQQYNDESLKVALIRNEQLMALEQVGSLEYEKLQLERLQLQSDFAQKSIDLAKAEAEAKRVALEDGFKKELLDAEHNFLTKEQTEEEYRKNVLDINQRRIDELLKLEKEGTTSYQDLVNEKLRLDKEYADKSAELDKQAEEKKREEREKTIEQAQAGFDKSVELINSITDTAIEASEANISRIEEESTRQEEVNQRNIDRLNEQLTTARGNDKKRIESEIKKAEELGKIQQQESARQVSEEQKRVNTVKRAQLAVMAIQEAVALARAFAELGPIAGTVAAIALAVKFAFLFDQIETAQFAKGTDFVKRGKNKSGVDTVPAMLSEGEAVIPVKHNLKNRDLVKSLVKGNVDDFIHNHYVLPRLQKALTEKAVNKLSVDAKLNDRNIVNGIKGQTRATGHKLDRLIQVMEDNRERRRRVA